MKIQLLLFFAIVTPVVLFFSVLLYGGVSVADIKHALATSSVYSQIQTYFLKQDAEIAARNPGYTVFFSKLLTQAYIQAKTESALDDSANWITGRTQTPPTISFKEIKDEIQSQAPELLNSIEYIPTQAEFTQANATPEEQTKYLEQVKQLKAFVDSDFILPIGNYLEGIRLTYRLLQLLLPIMILMLTFNLVLLVKLANSPPAKCMWLGTTLLTSSLVGYGFIFSHAYITTLITRIPIRQEFAFLSLFSPIILAIINHYVEIYIRYQEMVSAVFLAGALVCFVGAFITRKQAVPNIKHVYDVRSYWETPTKGSKVTK